VAMEIASIGPKKRELEKVCGAPDDEYLSFSERMWGFTWSEYLPVSLPTGVTLYQSTFDEMSAFATRHFARIYQHDDEGSAFVWFESGEEKKQFYKCVGDFIRLEFEGETIGMFVGNPVDWGTYYIRSISIFPEMQGRGIFQSLLQWVFATLGTIGVARVEADISVSNLPSLKGSLNVGFSVVGQTISERWGALVLLRNILKPEFKQVFQRQFCHSRPRNRVCHGGSVKPSPQEGDFS
jgi:RimJ/RimL family protein N-acetyltransferase